MYVQQTITKQGNKIYLNQIEDVLKEDNPEEINDALVFVLAADLLQYIENVIKMTKKHILLFTPPADFSRITAFLVINLQKVCFKKAKEKSVKNIMRIFNSNGLKSNRFQCGFVHCWYILKWEMIKMYHTILDLVM